MPENQDILDNRYMLLFAYHRFHTGYFDDSGAEDIRHVILDIREVLQWCVASCQHKYLKQHKQWLRMNKDMDVM